MSILAQAPANQQLGEFTVTVFIASNGVQTALPIDLTVSSDSLMNLTVIVKDEFSFYASGQPLVNDSTITLINDQRSERPVRLTQSTEFGNGTVEFINIYEDRYEMTVEAPSHHTIHGVIVPSVEHSVLTVFLGRRTVTYSWSVTPTSFHDLYFISVEADFETRVPVPVVTVAPTEIDLRMLDKKSFSLNITNHGLIRAEDVSVVLPNYPLLQFSTSTQSLGSIEALSSVIVSINFTQRSLQKRNAQEECKHASSILPIYVPYSYICDMRHTRYAKVILKLNSTTCSGQIGKWPRFSGDADGSIGDASFTVHDSPGGEISGSGWGSDHGGTEIVGSASFDGYVSKIKISYDSCISALLRCMLPSPLDLVLEKRWIPYAGCIPLILEGKSPIGSINNALDWLQCTKGTALTGFANCAYQNGLFKNCLQSRRRKKRSIRRLVNELTESLFPIQQSIALGTEVLGDEVWISIGDPQWLASTLRPALADESEAGLFISPTELATILAAPPPNGTTTVMVSRMVERINNTLSGWYNGQLEPEGGSNGFFQHCSGTFPKH